MLEGSASRRGVYDASEAIERALPELFQRELDVATSDVFVKKRGAGREGGWSDVAGERPDDCPARERRRVDGRELLLPGLGRELTGG